MEMFIKELNAKRKTGSWYQYIGVVEGKNIRIKGYKTWIQIYSVDGISYGGCMDVSVKQFNETLASPFKEVK